MHGTKILNGINTMPQGTGTRAVEVILIDSYSFHPGARGLMNRQETQCLKDKNPWRRKEDNHEC